MFVCALILWRSGLGLLIGKFHQFLTHLSACHTILLDYYHSTFLSVLQEQKRNYRSQKKQAARELLSTLKDPSVIVLADWLKIRGTLKSWTKLWCVLKPGLLILYKSEKQKVRGWLSLYLYVNSVMTIPVLLHIQTVQTRSMTCSLVGACS